MPRPKSDDPKEALTVRLRRSLAMRVTDGEDWRARLEAVIAAAYEPVVVKAVTRAAPAVHVDVPVFKRKAFNPRPKTGKAKR